MSAHRFSAALMLSVLVGACQSKPAATPQQASVALVNGEAIERKQFDEAVEHNLRRYGDSAKHLAPTMEGRLQESVLRQMVEERLVAQKASQLGIVVSDQEIDGILAGHRERFRSPESYRDYLSRANSTEASLREDLRKSLLTDRVVDKEGGDVTITHEEVVAAYTEGADRFLQPERMRLHRLWRPCAPNASGKERARVIAEMRRLKKQIAKESFEAVCRRASKAPEAERGGDMGLVLAGRYLELDRAIAAGMQPGDVSEPLAVDGGIALFRLDEHQPRGQKPLEEVEPAIRTSLAIKKRNERRQAVLRKLQDGAEVRTLVAFETGVKTPSTTAGGRRALPDGGGAVRGLPAP